MKITKSSVVIVVLIVWAVFSIAYIGWINWNNYKINQLQKAASQGYAQAIVDVAAEANKCASTGVPLNVGKDKDGKAVTVTIVGVSCLKQAEAPAANTAQPGASSASSPAAPKK